MTGNHFDQLWGGGITSASIGLELGQLSISKNTPESYGSFKDLNSVYGRYLPSNFAKITFNINRNQTVIADDLNLKLNVVGQFSNVNLNSAEQFYLGGPYGVRAYPSAQAGGSQGAMINIELQKKLPEDFAAIAFFDAGTVQQFRTPYPDWQGATNANNIYSLAGAGVGVKYVSKGLSVAATVAWRIGSNPLYNQLGVAVNTDNTNTNPMAWLTLSYQFGVD
jgi:hemolysin activation/secretion protein